MEEEVEREKYEVWSKPIETLMLSTRTYNILKKNHISTVGDLLKISTNKLDIIKGAGEVVISEIKKVCNELKTSMTAKEIDK